MERAKQYATLAVVWVGLLLPYLFASGVVGRSNEEVSDRYFSEVVITPADYTFVIWLPIYLGLLAFAVFQALPAQQDNPRLMRVRPWLAASAVLNAIWLFAFGQLEFGLSLLTILGMLLTALVMHRLLEIGESEVSGLERWLRWPFSLYAGWLSVATIVNAAGVLAVNDWGGWGLNYVTWGVLVLLVGAVIALLTRFRWNDVIYAGVFVWAYLGVAVGNPDQISIVMTAALMLLAILVLLLLPLLSRRRSQPA